MKLIYIISLLVLIISCSKKNPPELSLSVTQSCQKLSDILKKKNADTSQIKEVLSAAYALSEKESFKTHDSLIAAASQFIGLQMIPVKKFNQARTYYEKGLATGLRQFSHEDLVIATLYLLIGRTYNGEEDFKKALIYLDSVKINGQDSAALAVKTRTLIAMGESHQRLKNIKSADYFYQNAMPMVESYLLDRDKVNFYQRYAFFLQESKKFKEAISMVKRSRDILEKTIKEKTAVRTDTNNLANAYYYIAYALQDSTAYKAAEPYYMKALIIYKSLGNMEDYRRGLLNMGLMYRYDKQFDKALKVLTEGITQLDVLEQSDFNVLRKAKLFNNRAEVFMDLKDYYKALSDHDSAIFYLTLYDRRASLTTLLLANQKSLIWAYGDNARAYAALAEKGLDTEGYAKSLKMIEKVIEVADDIRADYFSDDAKLTLANDIKPALEKAISLCQNLYKQTNNAEYLEKAFGFVEYSRSMVLYENARLTNQLPDDLKTENAQLKAQEAALLSKNNIEELQKYLQHKRQFREKIKALNKNKLASIKDLQSNLLTNDQTAFIEYFVGDSSIFTFVLLKNTIIPFETKKPKDFEESIGTFRQEFTQHTPVRDASSFSRQSMVLYDILLRGPLTQLPPTVSKLVIAPDGVLAYLPFDVLTPSKISDGVTSSHPVATDFTTNFRQADFLLKHFTISYAYSANLLLLQKQAKQRKTKHLFASFIAKYEEEKKPLIAANFTSKANIGAYRSALSRNGLEDLQGAKDEVNAIRKVIGHKAFEDSLATEGSFKREAAQYRILHLAMHAYADDQDPMLSHLLFTLNPKDTTEDGDLTAAELYAMNLNADLAVLSACNTGFGTLSKGEGVMSLARAFTYAGVPATVTSLWEAPDATTPGIMESFYKNLKLGMPKDDALRQAKLTYLKNAHESLAANPYLWASFVPMGNMDAIDLEEKGPLSNLMADFGFWIGAGVGVLALVIWGFIWRRKKRN